MRRCGRFLSGRNWLWRIVRGLSILALCVSIFVVDGHALTGEEKAWAMFEVAATCKSATRRAVGIRALGLLRDNPHARELAENALKDPRPEVRSAAAAALGQMHALEAIPKLQALLTDKRMAVVMAAAQSLHELKDDDAANEMYLEVLSGERKGDSLIRQQLDTLDNPKQLAVIGVEEGIGYVPFAGIGWEAWQYTHKKNPHPPRAVAASVLAHDPSPKVGRALLRAALNDKDWIVRDAAIESLAERGDPSVKEKLELCMFDSNAHVRYTAAAAVIRLSIIMKNNQDRRLQHRAAAAGTPAEAKPVTQSSTPRH